MQTSVTTTEAQQADDLPAFTKEEDYKTGVRPKMLKAGWKPARSKDGEANCAGGGKNCQDFPELEAGPSSPQGAAIFRWERNGKVVLIRTLDDPAFYSEHEFEKAAPPQTAKAPEFSKPVGSGTGEAGEFAKWNFVYGADQFEITDKGRGKRITSTNETTEIAFTVPLKRDESIDSIYYAKYQNDLLLLYGVSDGESGGGTIARLDAKSLKPKWIAAINGFNLCKGAIEGQTAYLGAIGFAAKIDLETGKYSWKHDDLYRKYDKNGAFNIFETPSIDGENIIFIEKEGVPSPNTIVFNKNSGKVVKVNLGGTDK